MMGCFMSSYIFSGSSGVFFFELTASVPSHFDEAFYLYMILSSSPIKNDSLRYSSVP